MKLLTPNQKSCRSHMWKVSILLICHAADYWRLRIFPLAWHCYPATKALGSFATSLVVAFVAYFITIVARLEEVITGMALGGCSLKSPTYAHAEGAETGRGFVWFAGLHNVPHTDDQDLMEELLYLMHAVFQCSATSWLATIKWLFSVKGSF